MYHVSLWWLPKMSKIYKFRHGFQMLAFFAFWKAAVIVNLRKNLCHPHHRKKSAWMYSENWWLKWKQMQLSKILRARSSNPFLYVLITGCSILWREPNKCCFEWMGDLGVSDWFAPTFTTNRCVMYRVRYIYLIIIYTCIIYLTSIAHWINNAKTNELFV